MSQNVFTKNGWVQTSGNVNPQLIDDVNQRIDGYADGGYLPKNLLKITNNATTNNGITYTPNADGSVTMNGTASATSIFRIMTSLPNGKYYIHSGIQLSNNLMIQIYDSSNNASSITQDDSVVEKDIVEYRIRVASGQALNNVKIYPMITTQLSDFVPFTKSNVELQNEIDSTPIEYTITPSDKVTSSSYFKLLVKGKFAQLIADVTYTTNATAYTVDLLGTLPSDIKPFGTTNLNFMGTYNLTDTALKSIIINPNNKTISAQCGQTNQSKRLFINITFLLE